LLLKIEVSLSTELIFARIDKQGPVVRPHPGFARCKTPRVFRFPFSGHKNHVKSLHDQT
jgi:hypothetical protein